MLQGFVMRLSLSIITAAILCGGCTASTGTRDLSRVGITLFEAAADQWRFTMFSDRVRYIDLSLNQEWWGPLPARRITPSGSVFAGELTREYAIGGLAEEDSMTFSLEVELSGCRDASGRSHPTAVRLRFSPEYVLRGCGNALPPGA
jgi:hypothetical protein